MKLKYIVFLLSIIVIILSYNYIYKDHRDIKMEKARYIITSKSLATQFNNNTEKASKKFLNKTLEITGNITEKNKKSVTLNNNIFCQFSNPINTTKLKNSTITIKGRCIGFDDLLEEIKLDQCIIISSKS